MISVLVSMLLSLRSGLRSRARNHMGQIATGDVFVSDSDVDDAAAVMGQYHRHE